MFGESESESPRTGSPWDGFLSKSDPASPAVEPTRSPRVVPKLVPEVEEGNVEYKLRLLNPSTERFTRLITQLKWRLLEGGGQAYYELGVADSGQLVGLSRTHLEQSLQTLEEMAGEIGASVIVVKEIELPPALVEAVKNSEKSGKIADGAMRMHKVRVADYVETPPSSAGANEESELSAAETDDDLNGASTTHLSVGIFLPHRSGISYSQKLDEIDEASDSASGDVCGLTMTDLDFEIASVYKPRPHRRRTPILQPTPPKLKHIPSDDVFSLDLTSLHAHSVPVDVPKHRTSAQKIGKPEKDLRRALYTQIPHLVVDEAGGTDSNSDSGPVSASPGADTIGTSEHLKALDDLEAAAAMLCFDDHDDVFPGSLPRSENSLHPEDALRRPADIENELMCNDVMHNGILTPDDPTERRYIVEALVVRKMSAEETFLDFVNI
ncbi:hypothetical protein ACEPAH_7258 [Sanghuangporus vaninii]